MGYFTSACRYCNNDQPCDCRCHTLTQEDIEMGITTCDPVEYD